MICRIAVGFVMVIACAGGRICAEPESDIHVTQTAPYRFHNTIVRLRFDIARGLLYGDETAIVVAKHAVSSLPFHTKAIHYERIEIDGKPVRYDMDAGRELLSLRLDAPAREGTTLRIDFRYWARPLRGVYFVKPDKFYRAVTLEIWSQGEPTDNRRWFPTWDEPNEKTSSELVLTVPLGWTAIANGFLRVHRKNKFSELWDWKSPKPKSTYLIAFAAGPLVRYHSALGTLDVDSYVQPQYASLNAICFGRTKDMIAYYQRVTGVTFPFAKYDQITAERFAFGGMEDASATIVTDRALHPAVEDVEDSCDSLVSHELAQHWYGDDATMADWSNLWLNEGFATYYDELWTGERLGRAAFEYARYNAQQTYFAEAARSMRPVVDYAYSDPLTLFDSNSHERPAAILHMLRGLVGDERFFRAVHDYLRAYSYKNADTQQFFAAMNTSLRMDLTWFEQEWFFRSASPHYEVADHYEAGNHKLNIIVRQRNADGRPFRMPIAVEVTSNGHTRHVDPLIDRNIQTVTITNVSSRPDMVLFNPDNVVLGQVTFHKPLPELVYQLRHAVHVGDREWALTQLGIYRSAKSAARKAASAAVAAACAADQFWGMRADAVTLAAQFGNASAVQRALHDPDVRVRLAAANAAAWLPMRAPGVLADLHTMARDPDPNVVAAALTALGSLKAPGIVAVLTHELHRPSFGQAIAAGAMQGLAADCSTPVFALIEARTTYGTPEPERNAAVSALAACARTLKRPALARRTLSVLASSDPLIGTRLAAVRALALLGDAKAIPVLEHVVHSDSQEIVRESAAQAASALALQKD